MDSSERKESKSYDRKPNHEFKVSLSKDKKYWIFKNIVTWIVPTNYLGTISQSKTEERLQEVSGQLAFEIPKMGK